MDRPKPKKMAFLREASQRSAIDPFIAMDVLSKANEKERAGESIIHMEVGQPSTSAPLAVLEAARQATLNDKIGYTEALGVWPLREKIAEHYKATYGVSIDPDRVVVTTGSSAGFILSFLALLDGGDRVGVCAPGYPSYRHILSSLGNVPIIIETDGETRWAPSLEHLNEIHHTSPLKALLVASPANPTGTMVQPAHFSALIKRSGQLGIRFMSDEIYHGLTYEMPSRTALEFSDDVFVINSFSKYFSMTGWRIGWIIVPRNFVRGLERLQQNLFISPPTLSQFAAIAALNAQEELEAHRRKYLRNRNMLLDEFSNSGLTKIAPADGAFYLYADVSRFCEDSVDFAARMLDEIGVAATPGVDFDKGRGARYLRFSYAGAEDEMRDAAKRIKNWLG